MKVLGTGYHTPADGVLHYSTLTAPTVGTSGYWASAIFIYVSRWSGLVHEFSQFGTLFGQNQGLITIP